jgi:hypothetical protein
MVAYLFTGLGGSEIFTKWGVVFLVMTENDHGKQILAALSFSVVFLMMTVQLLLGPGSLAVLDIIVVFLTGTVPAEY